MDKLEQRLSTADSHDIANEKADLESSAACEFEGAGTHDAPYIVRWAEGDPRNPQNWSRTKKW